jgi:ferredoxin
MIVIDQALCSGCGLCIELCPEVFALSEDGKAIVAKQECGSCSLEDIVDQCPMEAIDI